MIKPEDTFNREVLECPYCGHIHKDAWELSPGGEDGEIECDECGKEFLWTRDTITYYRAKPKTI